MSGRSTSDILQAMVTSVPVPGGAPLS
jgi:hypothetical protein